MEADILAYLRQKEFPTRQYSRVHGGHPPFALGRLETHVPRSVSPRSRWSGRLVEAAHRSIASVEGVIDVVRALECATVLKEWQMTRGGSARVAGHLGIRNR